MAHPSHPSRFDRLEDGGDLLVEQAPGASGVDEDPLGVEHDASDVTENGEGDEEAWVDLDAVGGLGPPVHH